MDLSKAHLHNRLRKLFVCGFVVSSAFASPAYAQNTDPELEYLSFENSSVIDQDPSPNVGNKRYWTLVNTRDGVTSEYDNNHTPVTDFYIQRALICSDSSNNCDNRKARSGDKFFRMPTAAQGSNSDKTRMEFAVREDYFKHGDDVWIGFSFRTSPNWNNDNKTRNSQLAAGPDGCGDFGHSITLYYFKNRIELWRASGLGGTSCGTGGGSNARVKVGEVSIDRDKWYDFVINFTIDPTSSSNGKMKAWLKKSSDGKYGNPFINYNGVVGWTGNPANTKYETRIGHYGATFSDAVYMDFDEIRIGKVNEASFNVVNPDSDGGTTKYVRLENLEHQDSQGDGMWLQALSNPDGANSNICPVFSTYYSTRGIDDSSTGDATRWDLMDAGNDEFFIYNKNRQAYLMLADDVSPDGSGNSSCGSMESIAINSVPSSCLSAAGSRVRWKAVRSHGEYFRIESVKRPNHWLQMMSQQDIDTNGGKQVRSVVDCHTGTWTLWKQVPAGN